MFEDRPAGRGGVSIRDGKRLFRRVGRATLMTPRGWFGFSLLAGAMATAQTAASPSYYEFGTVVAIGHGTIDIQTFDQQRQRLVQHSFAFTRETRADIVHVNDPVEVVFTPASTGWELRRMIVMAGGLPVAGPPPPFRTDANSAGVATAASSLPAAVPNHVAAPLPAPAKVKPPKKSAHATPPPALGVNPATASAGAVAPTALGANAKTPVQPAVVSVALGSPAEAAARVAAHKTRDVAIATPAEECNRSSQDWPSQPIRFAVLDFRYPTEREEAHDIGTTGGGSGTAVADLVFARLETDEETNDQYLWSRADRRRLDRSDFAGAARLGRQLGVDAVLAGTFVPVTTPVRPGDDTSLPKAYELKAGVVDTCTGQLLVQVASLTCAGGLEPGVATGANPESCHHLAVSPNETADPKAHPQAFKPVLDAMLFPLEHDGMPPGKPGTAGVVSSVNGNRVTVQLAPGVQVKRGMLVALLASRLAKNPTTYTLRRLQSEEIGRVTVQSVQGATITGSYVGDYVPRAGDSVDLVTQ